MKLENTPTHFKSCVQLPLGFPGTGGESYPWTGEVPGQGEGAGRERLGPQRSGAQPATQQHHM